MKSIFDLNSKEVIWCKTVYQAIQLESFLNAHGFKWISGQGYLTGEYQTPFEPNICYNVKDGCHGDKEFYMKYNYKIIPLELIKEFHEDNKVIEDI